MNEVTTSQDVESLTGFGESGRLLLPFTNVKSLTGFGESDESLYRYLIPNGIQGEDVL